MFILLHKFFHVLSWKTLYDRTTEVSLRTFQQLFRHQKKKGGQTVAH